MASPNFDIFADGDGIRIASWEIRGQKGPIAVRSCGMTSGDVAITGVTVTIFRTSSLTHYMISFKLAG